MAQPTLNPYPMLATQFSDGMDAIIAALPGSPTDEDLVTAVYNYISGLGYLSSPPEIEVRSVAYSAINSITNGQTGNYNGSQWRFINLLTGPAFTSFLTVDSLNDRILDIEDNLPKCGLSVEAQNPLFMATIIGKTAYSYLFTQIGLGGGSSWSTYFVEALTSATANVPFWVAASMRGALIGAGSTMRGMIAPTTDIVTVQIVSALTAALTITAGKIIFLWIPRIFVNRDVFNPAIPTLIPDTSIPQGSDQMIACPERQWVTDNNNGCSVHWMNSNCSTVTCLNGSIGYDGGQRVCNCGGNSYAA